MQGEAKGGLVELQLQPVLHKLGPNLEKWCLMIQWCLSNLEKVRGEKHGLVYSGIS